MNKISILLIIALLLTGLNVFTVAANSSEIITPYWINITGVDGRVSYNENSNVGNVSIFINGKSGVTKITATATLYYKNSSNRWVKTTTE